MCASKSDKKRRKKKVQILMRKMIEQSCSYGGRIRMASLGLGNDRLEGCSQYRKGWKWTKSSTKFHAVISTPLSWLKWSNSTLWAATNMANSAHMARKITKSSNIPTQHWWTRWHMCKSQMCHAVLITHFASASNHSCFKMGVGTPFSLGGTTLKGNWDSECNRRHLHHLSGNRK